MKDVPKPWVSGWAVAGVKDKLGVSGYSMENGPGVWVRCDGWIYSSPECMEVSSRNGVERVSLESLDEGFGVRGEEFSIAAV